MDLGEHIQWRATGSMKKVPVGTLFVLAAVLFFFAAMANPANRAVYIALGAMFLILSISRRKKEDGGG